MMRSRATADHDPLSRRSGPRSRRDPPNAEVQATVVIVVDLVERAMAIGVDIPRTGAEAPDARA
jgi:hypothetical protein